PLEPLAPARIDAGIGRIATFVLEPGPSEALLGLGRTRGERLEVLTPADDALGLEALPDDLAVLPRLAADLFEDAVDVEELEGRFAATLERRVEAFIDGAVEAGALAAHREHVDAHDEQACLREPRLVVAGLAALARLRVAMSIEQRAELLPR